MDDASGYNMLKLQSCLKEIHDIFQEGERLYKEKITKLEEEKSVLYGLLDNKNEFENGNTKMKIENKVLKAEVNFLRLNTNDYKLKLANLETKYDVFKKDVMKKQLEWTAFIHNLQKKCSCKFKENIKQSKSFHFSPAKNVNIPKDPSSSPMKS